VWQTGPQSEFADVQVLVKHNRKLLPNDTTFHYFNDDSRDLSMHNLSVILASEGVVNGSYDAYMDLVPFAFRADLWRAAMVWVHGGIYLDHKMVLKQPYVAPFVV
jgi:mannosyltransferase OCH1-like enzyme